MTGCSVTEFRPDPARKLYDIYHCCAYSEKFLMMDTELSETCRVLFQNKFEKLVYISGFIIRIYHDARSPESQICLLPLINYIKMHGQQNIMSSFFFYTHWNLSILLWSLLRFSPFLYLVVYWSTFLCLFFNRSQTFPRNVRFHSRRENSVLTENLNETHAPCIRVANVPTRCESERDPSQGQRADLCRAFKCFPKFLRVCHSTMCRCPDAPVT